MKNILQGDLGSIDTICEKWPYVRFEGVNDAANNKFLEKILRDHTTKATETQFVEHFLDINQLQVQQQSKSKKIDF